MSASVELAGGKLKIPCSACGQSNSIPIDKLLKVPVCGSCKGKLGVGVPVEATDQNFSDLIGQSPLPVLVDFWAPWCGPCRMMTPALESFATRKVGEVIVAKLNTQDNPITPGSLGIKAIPTLIVFKEGKEAKRQVGAVQEQALNDLLA